MKNKALMVALAAVMTVSAAACFAGCGGKTQEIEWLIMRDDDQEIGLSENPVMNYWQEQTGIEIKWYDPVSKGEAWSQQLIDGEYSEIVDLSLNTENLATLEQDGVIWDIAPYVEECMPNFWKILNDEENWSDIRRSVYVGEKLYTVPIIEEQNDIWGGYMYRHDMVVDVKGEDFTWPSGEEEPTTIADWEFIMDAVVEYYEKHNITGAYPMYLAPEGYYATGILLNGFGVGGQTYLVDDKVHFGMSEDGFYDYLVLMKSWFQDGYISPDFSAQDYVFPSIDTSSLFTDRLGVFLGYTQFLGNQLEGSIVGSDGQPVDGVDIRPLASPLKEVGGEAVGVISPDLATRVSPSSGYAITKSCDEETMKTILKALDWFFSEEGSRTRTMGLSAEQGAAECEYYVKKGITNGTRLPNSETWTEEMDNITGEKTAVNDFAADRMPGVRIVYEPRAVDGDYQAQGNAAWGKYGSQNTFPYVVSSSQTPEESAVTNPILESINDYATGLIQNFILGREALTEAAFDAYQVELEKLGLPQYLETLQTAYNRYYNLG